MKLKLIAVGTRMPGWVADGFREYATRLPPECRLDLVEIPLGTRGKSRDPHKAVDNEGRKMLAVISKRDYVVALDAAGRAVTTEKLAQRLEHRLQEGRDVVLLIGGPDGLAEPCRQRADWIWSLSPLTLPHALVRVIVAEQLYRAWSILQNHPYHRA